jgi:hypothetical protein
MMEKLRMCCMRYAPNRRDKGSGRPRRGVGRGRAGLPDKEKGVTARHTPGCRYCRGF